MPDMRLSVIIPVLNEQTTIQQITSRVLAEPHEKELIIVDDGSSDGTCEILQQLAEQNPGQIKVVVHPDNRGKGAAVRSGLEQATGELVIIQDADLEYDPVDYGRLLRALEESQAHVVYGSRFLAGRPGGWSLSYLANRFLARLTNLLYGGCLTDMETCYKLIRRELLQSIPLRSRKFEIEAEITAKLLKRGVRIVEVPISYQARDYAGGKKIGWRDGLQAIWTLVKYRLVE